MSQRLKTKKYKQPFKSLRRQPLILPVAAIIIFALAATIAMYFSSAQRGIPPINTPIAANPPIDSRACIAGLNIALLADDSPSIKQSDFVLMQGAFRTFVSSLLPSSKVSFSITYFNSPNAGVLQGFTSDVTALNNAINRIPAPADGTGTDWALGLRTASNSFISAQAGRQNLLIIATDGNPLDGPDPINSAIREANTLKNNIVHILALGIGTDITLANLKAISGPTVNSGSINTDVITTNFSTLSKTLTDFANNSCGTGTGSIGTGSGGSGTGTGGTGSGTGVGGSGSGTGGSGSGTSGGGTGATGSGSGTTTGPQPQPSPTQLPTATQSTQPSPAPTHVPNKKPTPAPTATPTPQPQPNPAPKATAQGNQSKPPVQNPSPFFDGKEYAHGSSADDFAVSAVRHKYTWLYAIALVFTAIATAAFIIWRERKKPNKTSAKRKK
jgi:hypothetical protein